MEGTKRFYSQLAQDIQWYKNGSDDYKGIAEDKIRELEKQLPYGSGVDAGSSVNLKLSTGHKIVIDTAFHHMNENGCYDGWTYHQVIITPCLMFGYKLRVTGRNRNRIKDHLYNLFDDLSIN